MAFLTTTRVLYDGPRKAKIQITGLSDGSGDEHLIPKIVCKDLEGAPQSLKIEEIEYNVSGGLARIYFDAADPVEIADLVGWGELDYCSDDSTVNDPRALSYTGNILLSTMGFDSGSSYTIRFDVKKSYKNPPPLVQYNV